MFRSIAVSLDATALEDPAISYALAIARQTGGTVELLHVSAIPEDGADATAAKAEAERLEERARRIGANAQVRTASWLLRGNPVEAILSHLQAAGANVIVLAAAGRGVPSDGWPGSIADALLRQSGIPVLLVRPQRLGGSRERVRLLRILVPLDGTTFSEALLPEATELARLFDARLQLLYVAEPDGDEPLWSRPRRPGPQPRSAAEYLEELAERFPGQRDRLQVKVLPHSTPSQAILAEARNGNFDLIVMASHGRGGIRPLVLGSTTENVLLGTDIPVLVYRAGTSAAPQDSV